jgi:hypothetical protein
MRKLSLGSSMERIAMKKLLLFAFLSMAASIWVRADHLPEKLMAVGNPEDTLAGINMRTSTFEDVLKEFGLPSKKITVPNNPAWTGYLWRSGDIQLEVEVTHGKSRDSVDTITVVHLIGVTSQAAPNFGTVDSTGRGLKLGDSLDTLKRLYGSRFKVDNQDNVPDDTQPFLSVPGSQTATIQWMKLDFTLTAGLDRNGKIVAMRLRLPSCYPGGCQ